MLLKSVGEIQIWMKSELWALYIKNTSVKRDCWQQHKIFCNYTTMGSGLTVGLAWQHSAVVCSVITQKCEGISLLDLRGNTQQLYVL